MISPYNVVPGTDIIQEYAERKQRADERKQK